MIPRKREVRKVGGKSSTTTKKTTSRKTTARRRNFDEDIDLTLPTAKLKPTGSLSTAKIFLHGETGIGKTELCSMFPDPLFLFFEPGGEWLTIARLPRQGQFTKWQQFVTVVDKLVGNRELNIPPSNLYENVVIDTADLAWDLASKFICEEAGEDDIDAGTLGYQRGPKKLRREFITQILRLTGSGRGVIFISHTKSSPFEKVSGVKTDKLIATIEEKGRVFLDGWCDLVGCYAYSGEDRYLIIRGSDNVQAKCRIPDHFMTTDDEQVYAIPMGESAAEGYENFMAAFNNQQEDPERLRRRVQLSETKVKWKAR